jgi:glutathione S-transferase
MIKLFWCPRTRASRVLWLMEELGCDFDLVTIDIRDEASRDNADFRRASPMGKVPAILDGDTGLSDSAAIGLYLCERFPDAGLAPAVGDPARADFLYWMLYTPGVIEPAMAEKFGGWETNKTSHGWGDFASMISVLEDRLKDREWLVGDAFSAADVMVGSSVHFLKLFGILPEGSSLDAYAERCLARPAFQRALARDEGGDETAEGGA